MEGAQAKLTSPSNLTQSIAAAEAATVGKVSNIAYQNGAKGASNAILAHVMLADGAEKTIALNPADGSVLTMKMAVAAQTDSENDNGSDTGESETGND